MKTHFVYCTTRDSDEAAVIGRFLVESRLAACVNILADMNSIYIWEGELQQDHEAVLIAKTTEPRLKELIEAIKKRHSYDCPCIVSFPIGQGNLDYLNWIADQVR